MKLKKAERRKNRSLLADCLFPSVLSAKKGGQEHHGNYNDVLKNQYA